MVINQCKFINQCRFISDSQESNAEVLSGFCQDWYECIELKTEQLILDSFNKKIFFSTLYNFYCYYRQAFYPIISSDMTILTCVYLKITDDSFNLNTMIHPD